MSLVPGTRFGRYRLISELGRGGEAIVYLADDELLARPVALKVFPLAIAPIGDAAPTRFRNEVEILSRLDHPGICRIHEAGIVDGLPFIAMSYVEGHTLDASAKRGEAEAIALVEDVARIVASSHAAGVIHGDLKPQNVLVTRSGSCVVLDFGISRFLGETRGGGSERAAGTLPYLAPEVFRRPPHPASDVYALGAILFELVTHRTPFVAPTGAALVQKILIEDAPLCRIVAPKVSRPLEAVVAKALERDPGRRYATMADFADELGRLGRGETVAAARHGPSRRALRWARRRPALAALLGFALIFLASATTIAFVKNRTLARNLDRVRVEAGRSVAEAEAAERHLIRHARLADHRRQADLVDRARRLVPPSPALIPALEAWMVAAEALIRRVPQHRHALETLRAGGRKSTARRFGSDVSDAARREIEALQRRRARLAETAEKSLNDGARAQAAAAVRDLDAHVTVLLSKLARFDAWTYDSPSDGWHDATLSALIDDLERFGGNDATSGVVRGVARRIVASKHMIAVENANQARWDDAIRVIGDRLQSPLYGGLVLKPQGGLVPLGPNAETGLWEFSHVLSGEPAPDGGPGPGGVVLVLLPGGVARMGARQPRDGEQPAGPHLDAQASPQEGPIDDVPLDPFFISKLEMTEAQWDRAVGAEPREAIASRPPSVMPVVTIDWHEATRTLASVGLQLPTEAQWEHAARAGTATPWWTGLTAGTLRGAEVFSVKASSAVGALRPNAFGLFDVGGNVSEWCADVFATYANPKLPGTGARSALETIDQRVSRGGWYSATPSELRSARRSPEAPSTRRPTIGVRPARALDR